jgi:hypothetical protein
MAHPLSNLVSDHLPMGWQLKIKSKSGGDRWVTLSLTWSVISSTRTQLTLK